MGTERRYADELRRSVDRHPSIIAGIALCEAIEALIDKVGELTDVVGRVAFDVGGRLPACELKAGKCSARGIRRTPTGQRACQRCLEIQRENGHS